MKNDRQGKGLGYLAILLAMFFWGFSFVWIKQLLNNHFPVFTIVCIRLTLASAVFVTLFKLRGRLQRIGRGDFKDFLLLAFFEPSVRESIMRRIDDEGLTDVNEQIQYLRACVIGLLEKSCVGVFIDHEDEILHGTFQGSLIDHIPPLQHQAYEQCTRLSRQRIYRSQPVLDVELSGYRIMATLMELMVEAILHPERYYSQQLIGRVSSQYDIENDDLETRLMAVVDYISGMTDVYALDVYQKICGISLPIV